jgi:Xaa-Pro dipeptidase
MERRLEQALSIARADALVVHAGTEKLVFRDDAHYPFRVEPYFKAWVPLTHAPGSALKLVPGERPLLVYHQPEDFWHEAARDPSGFWVEHFDIRVVRSRDEAHDLLEPPAQRCTVVGEAPEPAMAGRVLNDPNLLSYLDFFRAFKTDYEIECMRRASAIAACGHAAVARHFDEAKRSNANVSEFDLHQTFCAATRQRETDLPYSNIIALNEHAATLHHQNLRSVPPSAVRSLLIDAGAQFHGYAADVTRTWNGSDRDFSALIVSMERLQQTLCAAVRAGVDFVELDHSAHRLLAGVLAEHGLIDCDAEQALDAGITSAFLPHGLGHLLGLQVHDAGGRQIAPDGETREPPAEHPYLRLTRVLEPGFALTIEPGIYFIPLLLSKLEAGASSKVNWRAVERFVPFGGIRIEDNVVVTEGAALNLTREAFAASASV